METAAAESIFELLTAKNLEIEYPRPASVTQTNGTSWHTPKQLKPWSEFNYSTLGTMYNGDLMLEARQKGRRLPSYPYIKPKVDCIVTDENTTKHVLTKWNHPIITAGLDIVQKFQPCDWVASTSRASSRKSEESNSVDNGRIQKQIRASRKENTRRTSRKSSASIRPDAGGASSARETPASAAHVERLPKEYKTASKWSSSTIFQNNLIDEAGTWKPGANRARCINPIRQAYTYCVTLKCRYGCILTTGEAFIFRIKPRLARPGESL